MGQPLAALSEGSDALPLHSHLNFRIEFEIKTFTCRIRRVRLSRRSSPHPAKHEEPLAEPNPAALQLDFLTVGGSIGDPISGAHKLAPGTFRVRASVNDGMNPALSVCAIGEIRRLQNLFQFLIGSGSPVGLLNGWPAVTPKLQPPFRLRVLSCASLEAPSMFTQMTCAMVALSAPAGTAENLRDRRKRKNRFGLPLAM